MLRAREELVRLDVEAARLQAWINDEDRLYSDRVESLKSTDPILAVHLQGVALRRKAVNDTHRQRLQKLDRLRGFATMKISTIEQSTGLSGVQAAHEQGKISDDEDADEGIIGDEDDDDFNDELTRVGDVVYGLQL